MARVTCAAVGRSSTVIPMDDAGDTDEAPPSPATVGDGYPERGQVHRVAQDLGCVFGRTGLPAGFPPNPPIGHCGVMAPDPDGRVDVVTQQADVSLAGQRNIPGVDRGMYAPGPKNAAPGYQ